ncbi:hypothetical protein D3C80_2001400 [compost metagenome]
MPGSRWAASARLNARLPSHHGSQGIWRSPWSTQTMYDAPISSPSNWVWPRAKPLSNKRTGSSGRNFLNIVSSIREAAV